MHVPKTITECEILKFKDALKEEQSAEKAYDSDRWLYIPCRYSEYRYVLGTKGKNPLICIGINPSTAEPDNLDNTLKSVERLAKFNGYDSFLMFNVYPQRATDPNDMAKDLIKTLHEENMQAFEYVLSLYKGYVPSIWAAWGTIIEMRPYLKDCVKSMIEIGERYNAKWYTLGARSKKGHPHHPLYLKKDTKAEEFYDIMDYLNSL